MTAVKHKWVTEALRNNQYILRVSMTSKDLKNTAKFYDLIERIASDSRVQNVKRDGEEILFILKDR